MARFHVVYDTCVLVPAPLRDFLLRAAEAATLRNPPRTYEDVLEFLSRSIPESVARLRDL